MQAANRTGLGIIRAGEETNTKIIGVDEWQGSINPDIVFWSALKDIGGATYKAGESSLDGNFVSGIETYNAATGIQLYDARDFDKLAKEVQDEVLSVVDKIKSGEIIVPAEVAGK